MAKKVRNKKIKYKGIDVEIIDRLRAEYDAMIPDDRAAIKKRLHFSHAEKQPLPPMACKPEKFVKRRFPFALAQLSAIVLICALLSTSLFLKLNDQTIDGYSNDKDRDAIFMSNFKYLMDSVDENHISKKIISPQSILSCLFPDATYYAAGEASKALLNQFNKTLGEDVNLYNQETHNICLIAIDGIDHIFIYNKKDSSQYNLYVSLEEFQFSSLNEYYNNVNQHRLSINFNNSTRLSFEIPRGILLIGDEDKGIIIISFDYNELIKTQFIPNK